ARERDAVVLAHVQTAVVAEHNARRARGLEGEHVVVGVRVRQRRHLAVQPPGAYCPVDAAVAGARGPEVAADPDRVARRVIRIDADRLVVPALAAADVHRGLRARAGDRVRRYLGADIVRDPGLAAVGRAIDVLQLGLIDQAGIRVDDRLARLRDRERGAPV